MDWIKIRTSLFEHPKVLKLSRLLRVKQIEALGLCVLLWSKAYGITKDGALGYAPEDLDQLIGKKGLTKALEEIGWAVVSDDGCVTLPRWHEYCGFQQDQQASARLRQQRSRFKKKNVTNNEEVTNNDLSQNVTVTKCDNEKMSRDYRYIDKYIDKKDNTSVLSKKAHTSIPSSFQEVVKAFPQFDREAVEKWFWHRSAQGWMTSGGVAIRDWKADLQLWMRNEPTLVNVEKSSEKNTGAAYVPTVSVEVN